MKRWACAVAVLHATLAVAVPAVEAQAPNRQAVVVYVWDGAAGAEPPALFPAFRDTLRELGRPEGPRLRVERRVVPAIEDRPRIASEIIAFKPDVIVAPAPAAAVFGPIPEKIGARFATGLPSTAYRSSSLGSRTRSGSGWCRAWPGPGGR